MAKKAGVYKILCKPTGKSYVGSAVDISSRWRVHRHDLRHGTHVNQHLQRAWSKHGEDSFVFSVLEIVDDISQLTAIEQRFIDALNSVLNGFNLREKADSNLGLKYNMVKHRPPHLDSSKIAMSETKRALRPPPGSIGNPKTTLVGMVFGRLTVVSFAGYVEVAGLEYSAWNCQCECGSLIVARRCLLTSKKTKSCGCLFRDTRPKNVSPEVREKIRAGHVGRVKTKEHIEKIRTTMLGKTYSAERKLAMSIGRKLAAEARKNG